MKSISLHISILFFVIVTCLTACKRDDDEPAKSKNPVSRLYLSFSEFRLDESAAPYNNVAIVDPADTTVMNSGFSYNSGVKGGAAILFSPVAKYVFQSSFNGSGNVNDTSIQVMSVDKLTGAVSYKGLISNGELKNVRGLAYHDNLRAENLYVSNIGAEGKESFIYLFQRPGNYRGRADFKQRIGLGTLRPWTMAFRGTEENSELFMSVTGEQKGIAIFSGILRKLPAADSVLTSESFPPLAILSIVGQGEIRGFNYSPQHDLLAVASYIEGANGAANQGQILLFENAGALLSSRTSKEITPTRIIKGAATGLVRPLDVAIDNREGAKFIYVVDAGTKKVSRFLNTDKGDVKPNEFTEFPLTPVGLSLDSRGPNDLY